jgi:hypothetical protein
MGRLTAWLVGGNDHRLAATQYAGRESATARNTRKAEAKANRRPKPARNAREADRVGWAAHNRADRRRYGD